ncbi:MAG: hypothetical protein KDE24_32080 [Caldilinea sp.]|nr:hypothetical protein [Caldilinea sp.]
MSSVFWDQITQLEGKALRTLDQGKPFVMLCITETAAVFEVKESGAIRTIERADLEPLYDRLCRTGDLSTDEVKAVAKLSRHISYASALLAQCKGVTATTRPIRLRYRVR